MTWLITRVDNGKYLFVTDGGFCLWTERPARATPYIDSVEADLALRRLVSGTCWNKGEVEAVEVL